MDLRLKTYWEAVMYDRKKHLAVLIVKYASQNAVPGLPTGFLYQGTGRLYWL